MEFKRYHPLISFILTILFITGCGGAQQAPATESPAITATPIPATATPLPPTLTHTSPPPTASLSPTATPAEEGIASHPSPRQPGGIAYDSESDKMIMFGGLLGGDITDQGSDETWVFDFKYNTWTNMQPENGPPKNCAPSLAYDSESDRTILHGGCSPTGFNQPDTWAYDYNTNTWQKMSPGPENHFGAPLAYDAESDRIILFGGFIVSNQTFLNDTWAYDYNSDTWMEMKPGNSPPGRNFGGMAYDSESDRIILFDGYSEELDPTVWAYDYNANAWQQMTSAADPGPGFRDAVKIAYDSEADRIILYGGASITLEGYNQTWAYDYNTNTWTDLQPATNPGPLFHNCLAYSPTAKLTLLFGGMPKLDWTTLSDETWTYDYAANTWTDVTSP